MPTPQKTVITGWFQSSESLSVNLSICFINFRSWNIQQAELSWWKYNFWLQIDVCQRLWVVDTGKIGLSTAPQACPPKILVFNLDNNQLIHRYQIPNNQYRQNTLFINPVSSQRWRTNIISMFLNSLFSPRSIHTFLNKSMKSFFHPADNRCERPGTVCK